MDAVVLELACNNNVNWNREAVTKAKPLVLIEIRHDAAIRIPIAKRDRKKFEW